MTVREMIRKLQAIEGTCGECHVFYDEEPLWVNLGGVEVREADLGGDVARYVAVTGYDASESKPPGTSSSSAANLVVAVISLPVYDPLGWLVQWWPDGDGADGTD